jgi:hypothetical protein
MENPNYAKNNASPGIDVYILPEGKKFIIKRGTYNKKIRRGKIKTK